MVEVAQSYETVCNFNNFKAFVMFAVKKIGSLAYLGRKLLNILMLVRKHFFDCAYVSPENFLTSPPPPSHTHFRERLGQNPRKCWSKHDDTPPPPLLMASRRPCKCGGPV
jgi:hypothetical protein